LPARKIKSSVRRKLLKLLPGSSRDKIGSRGDGKTRRRSFADVEVVQATFRPRTNALSDAIRQEKNMYRQMVEEETPSAIAAIYSTEVSSHNFLS